MPANHTPGPWQYHLGRGANPRFHIQTAGGYQIASTPELSPHSQATIENEAREANAAFIVLACNCHDELVETLKDVEANLTGRDCFPERVADSLRRIKEALAKARGSA